MNLKKALAQIEDLQAQYFDNLMSASELESQILRIEKQYMAKKKVKAVDKLKAKLLKEARE